MPEERMVMVRRLTRWQRIGVASLLVLGAMLIGGVIFVLSGIYNIGATREHWSITNFIITILRDRSVAVASGGVEVPELDDPDLYLLGGQHFLGACTSCHGIPGQPLSPIYSNMLPRPPDLVGAFEDYDAREVFWIVNNGLKYTGMPAWPVSHRPDEVWSVVSYLRRLNTVGPPDRTAFGAAVEEAQTFDNCARCHGAEGEQPISRLVPRLDGLPEPYLVRALTEFRDGIRASGMMAPVAHGMTDDQIGALAAYYAALPAAGSAGVTEEGDPEWIALGREIAEDGIAEQDVPACGSCHNGRDPQVPPLAGQSSRYLQTQLHLWRTEGYRDASAHGGLMALVARRLDAQQAQAVSAYFADQPRGEGSP